MSHSDDLERQRLEARTRGLRSTYYFGRFFCGFEDLDPDLHGAMARWVQRESRFKLGIAPRGHLKSSVWTVADVLRRATADPEMKQLIVNETRENIIKWIGFMQDTVLSESYRWCFPEVIPDPRSVRWNQTQLELRRVHPQVEPSIEGIGVGGASTSNHYHRIVNDDLVGKAARESPSDMTRAIDQYKLSNSLLVDPSKNSICTWGTRWGPHDLIDWLQKNTIGLDVLHLKVVKPNGDPLWPTRFPPSEIQRIRAEQGSEMFHLQYMNEALGEGVSEFDPKWLHHWRQGRDASEIILESPRGARVVSLDDMTIFQATDTGLSPESKDARSANIVVGLVPGMTEEDPFDIVLLEQRAMKSAPTKTISDALEVYDALQPSAWGIEAVGGHQFAFHWIMERRQTARLAKFKTDTHKSKMTRIREFGPYFSQGRFYVHRAHFDFMDEYVAFPNGRTVDLLDALAYVPQIWFPPDSREASLKAGDIYGIDLMNAGDDWGTGRDPITSY